ncbi:MAG: L-ribulose-5-phosphate 4-epimerase AraD [Acidobacteriota bacterium]|nr:L-ribulose-5-phosphate 4-epimerase AraD [Acidobacteriota bacterium]
MIIARELRESVYRANMALVESGLVTGTFGNVSGVDRGAGLFVIKPSGVPYGALSAGDMVPVSLETGKPLEGTLRPSSDTPTHLELYRAFDCGGIAHTHSEVATAFAQARLSIRCMGTTHADYFCGDIPVTRTLRPEEVERDYEINTGRVIIERFAELGLDSTRTPGVIIANHGPFAWGDDPFKAVEHAEIMEFLARLEWRVRTLAPDAARPDACLVDRHFTRKHGPGSYYGQK